MKDAYDGRYGAYGETVLSTDGLRHIVKVNGEWSRGFNGWSYRFECGADCAYMERNASTQEPATCLLCINNHTGKGPSTDER